MTERSAASGVEMLTPHVEPAWRDAFLVERRLAGVPGETIGDELATVDTHCADARESAQAAFGDPVAYARSLLTPASGYAVRPRTAVGLVLGVVALVTVPRAVTAWLEATPVVISVGDVVSLTLCVAAVVGLVRRPGPVLALIARRSWTLYVLPFVVLGVMLVPQALFRGALAELAPAAVAAVGLVALVAQVVLVWPEMARPDPVRDPRATTSPARSMVDWATMLVFPVLLLIMLGTDAVQRALT